MANTIMTRFLVLSDTHGADAERLKIPTLPEVDVAIHCGDLTHDSGLEEYHTAIRLLHSIRASLKLVIAGNHDWTLDPVAYQRGYQKACQKRCNQAISPDNAAATFTQDHGEPGDAKALFDTQEAKAAGIVFLDEGTHTFSLQNGAALSVYASPFTTSTDPKWGFQYNDKHEWTIRSNVDIAITHGPPAGIMDRANPLNHAGCPDLFAAVARAKPLMHCFGYVHRSWGAEKVVWRNAVLDRWRKPSYERAIEHKRTVVLATLEKEKVEQYDETSFCMAQEPIKRGKETLFVNAANEGARRGR
ncbi:putative rhamnogalacturonate lyase C [Fulvia fulva]|uniref:Rhamnogalacturonate lyase C n=1 Tax=Passalora fulva TaxID=5499 RepID=A0A9Q8LBS4_PASFU|nr:putative rhamnogalacturonate lyase C [Fulvia fulva]KAK4631833.1 putative rhamnogalacturonate lyase C [Fulvia fulva]KAK4632454.1 putative rhamnogalacturonate lyase C [Fulvia fulva]UJO14527.1 putative rhamnogalacturonate lyase C [Fulvia fulva]WPV10660.1 putative rhamnogalacturonate lyase C [Fulvia fulva]WPV25409.1 putative rhamnogalacturonate lyase C [Fulvia fulva]